MTTAATDLRALGRTGPVHFMGIGGAGMLALAELMARRGVQVTGCDSNFDCNYGAATLGVLLLRAAGTAVAPK